MSSTDNIRKMIIDLVDDSDDENHKNISELATRTRKPPSKPLVRAQSSRGKDESVIIYDSDDALSPAIPKAAELKGTTSVEESMSPKQSSLPILTSKRVKMAAPLGTTGIELPKPDSMTELESNASRVVRKISTPYLVKSAAKSMGSSRRRLAKPISVPMPAKINSSTDVSKASKGVKDTTEKLQSQGDKQAKLAKGKTGPLNSDSSSSEGIKGSAEKIARSRKFRHLHQSDSSRDKLEPTSASGQIEHVIESAADFEVTKAEQPQQMNLPPTAITAAQQVQRDSIIPRLTINSAEKILKKHTLLVDEDHEYFTKLWLPKARSRCQIGLGNPFEDPATALSGGISCFHQTGLQQTSPFKDMKGLSFEDASLTKHQPSSDEISETVLHSGAHSKPITTRITVTFYSSTALDVPRHISYVSLKDNIIAENNKKLDVWPYFESGQENEELINELKERYTLGHPEGRPALVKCLQRVQQVRPYILRYLKEVCSSLEDIVCYFNDQSLYNRLEDKHVLSPATLHDHVNVRTANAGIISAVFHKTFNFSMWHVAKYMFTGSTREQALQSGTATLNTPETCRICNLHNCQWHGEIREHPDGICSSDDESIDGDNPDINHKITVTQRKPYVSLKAANYAYQLSSVTEPMSFLGEDDNGVVSGICNRSAQPRGYKPGFPDDRLCSEQCFWLKSNRRTVSACCFDQDTQLEYEEYLSAYGSTQRGPCMVALGLNKSCSEVFMAMLNSYEDANESEGIPPLIPINVTKRSAHYWVKNSITANLDKRRPFYPCKHEGSCEDAQCSCYREEITCEKTCCCDQNCERRFHGCSCHQTPRMICFYNDKCECYILGRECDPDLCRSCGAAEVLDPLNRDNNAILQGRCGNVGLQRNVPRRTLLGKSEISGFGLYAGEAIKKHQLIGEYKGEVLAKGESNRRGAIYHYRATNYLFKLNSEQEVDSTLAGNKMRFINNADADENQNCYPKPSLTNGVIRLGLYARRDLVAGEELFFHYGYPAEATAHFVEKGQLPRIKGVARPVIASKSRTRKSIKTKKPRNKDSALKSTNLDISGKPGLQLPDLGVERHAMSKKAEMSADLVTSSSEADDEDDDDDDHDDKNIVVPFPMVNDDPADEDYRDGSVSPSQVSGFVTPARGRRGRKRKASA